MLAYLFILDLSYCDLRRSGPHHSIHSAITLCSHHKFRILSDTNLWSSQCSWEYASPQLHECAGSKQEGALAKGSMTRYILQMLQPDWLE